MQLSQKQHWEKEHCMFLCGIYVIHFFIFSPISITINHTISLKQTHLLFVHFLEYLILVLDDNMNGESV